MAAPLYNRDILRLAASIPHLGLLESADAQAERKSVVCGSRVAVSVRVDEKGRIAAIGQEVRACALGQASAAVMSGHAVGRSLEELTAARDSLRDYLAGNSDEPGDWPGITVLAAARPFHARHPSILLPFEAIAEAAALAVRPAATAE